MGHCADVYTCRFFPSGIVVLSGGADMQLKIWSAETGMCAATLIGHRGGNRGTESTLVVFLFCSRLHDSEVYYPVHFDLDIPFISLFPSNQWYSYRGPGEECGVLWEGRGGQTVGCGSAAVSGDIPGGRGRGQQLLPLWCQRNPQSWGWGPAIQWVHQFISCCGEIV